MGTTTGNFLLLLHQGKPFFTPAKKVEEEQTPVFCAATGELAFPSGND